MTPEPGQILAKRYRLEHRLGEGGMGEVWAATHLVTRRVVALKRLIAPRDERSLDEARARFVLEAQSTCAVAHPNVVEVLDFVDDGERPLIVMELLQGETLAQRLAREHALTLEETATILLPVVSAVGEAHARGIVHRDLKPSNIFLSLAQTGRARVKVLDFGIAKWITPESAEREHRTQTGSTLGTPSYMAPEQALGERSVDHRADIWSLGVMLYECLSGVRPVEGNNPAQVVMRLMSSGIMPIERLVPGLPPALAELVGRMLRREPRKRPQDLGEIFRALRGLTSIEVPELAKPRSDALSADAGAIPPEPAPEGATLVTNTAVATERPPRPAPSASQQRLRWGLWATVAMVATVSFSVIARRHSAGSPEGPLAPPHPAPLSAAALEPAAPSAPSETRLALEPAASTATAEATPGKQAATAGGDRSSSAEDAPRTSVRSKKARASERARLRPAKARNAAVPATPSPAHDTPAPVPAQVPPVPLARGAACDHSATCASRLCVAFRCR